MFVENIGHHAVTGGNTARQAEEPNEKGITYKRIPMVKGPGVGAKAEVTLGFVSMFRQAQHSADSTN